MTLHLHIYLIVPPETGGDDFVLIPSPDSEPHESDWSRLVALGHGDTSQARRLACHEQGRDPRLSWDQAVTRALHRWLHELAR